MDFNGLLTAMGKEIQMAMLEIEMLCATVEIYEMGRIAMSLKGQEITNKALSDCCFS